MPRPDRGAEPAAERLPRRRRRRRARRGPRRRRPPRRRGGARPVGRRPDRREGQLLHHRLPDHLRLQDAGGLGAAVRRHRRRQAARRGPRHRRQDQHGRVRDGVLHRDLVLRPHPQPVGRRAHPRRLGRRLGRGRGLVHGAAGRRFRHGRLHPPARRRHRHRRRQAHLRRRLPLRPGGDGLQPRPTRALHPDRRGRGAAAGDHRRLRPARLRLDRPARARPRRGLPRRRPGGPPRRHRRRVPGRRLRARRPRAVPRGR